MTTPSLSRGFLTIVLLAVVVVPAHAADSIDRESVERIKENTVYVKADFGRTAGTGSGFFLEDGLIVTNAHVIGQTEKRTLRLTSLAVVLDSGRASVQRELPVRVVGVDKNSDLAFLRPEGEPTDLPAGLRFVEAGSVYETMPVWICGFPFGDRLSEGRDPSITIGSGSVSSFRLDPLDERTIDKIQIDGDLNPGNSGGPIVDAAGDVVAVSVSTVIGTQIAFSIPADQVQRNLVGRVSQNSYRQVLIGDGDLDVAFAFSFVDPRQRIEQLHCRIWTGPSSEEGERETRDNQYGISFPAHGATGDTPMEDLRELPDENWQCVFDPDPLDFEEGHSFFVEVNALRAGERVYFLTEEVSYRQLQGMQRTLHPEVADKGRGSGRGGTGGSGRGKPGAASGRLEPAPDETWGTLPSRPEPVRGEPLPETAVSEWREEEGAEEGIPLVEAEVALREWVLINDVVSEPSGRRVFLANEESEEVTVLDATRDYREIRRISVAFDPSDLWVDDEWLVVASAESRQVEIFDTEDFRKVSTLEYSRNDKPYRPSEIVRRDHDGMLVVMWDQVGGAWWDHAVTWIDADGRIKHHATSRHSRVLELPTGEYVGQGEKTHHPCRTIGIVKPGGEQSGPESRIRNLKRAAVEAGIGIGRMGPSFHTDTGPVGFDAHRTGILIPIQFAGNPITIRTDLNFVEVRSISPGILLHQDPATGVGITWDWASLFPEKGDEKERILRYVDLRSGRCLRIVRLLPASADREGISAGKMHWKALTCFVPGREELILYRRGSTSPCEVIKCGPLTGKGSLTPRRPPSERGGSRSAGTGTTGKGEDARRGNDRGSESAEAGEGRGSRRGDSHRGLPDLEEEGAPVRAAVGQSLSFTPQRMVMPGMRFRIADPLPGMSISRSEGTWRWTPGPGQIGSHEIVIEGEMRSGGIVRVKTWTLEVVE